MNIHLGGGTLKNILLFVLVSSCLVACHKRNRDRIVFEDNVGTVRSSLKRMVPLMQKLRKDERINYFFDPDGFLYINNIKRGSLSDSVEIERVKDDYVFDYMNAEERSLFLSIVAYLKVNHVDACGYDKLIGCFTFDYRKLPGQSLKQARNVLILENDVDLSKVDTFYRILDQKGDIALIGFNDNVNQMLH
jgi:hypothetical protein